MKKKLVFLLAFLLLLTGGWYAVPDGLRQGVYARTEPVIDDTDTQIDLSQLLDMSELYGWAAVPGEGLLRVTGGGSAKPVVVTTLEQLEELAKDDVPRVLVISGTIRCGGYGPLVGSNKTIVGMDKSATLYGGFRIHNSSNIIISNLNIQGTWPNGGPDDCLEVKGSHHLWFNHLNIWDSTDGNVDITLGSDYVTVSWCKMWYSPEAADGIEPEQNHRLSCLIGSGAGDHDDTDMDKLRVTYHHNWFSNLLFERMPRVMYGRTHVYNNYYDCKNNDYCIGADSYASVLIENNYFKEVKDPHKFCYTPGLPASITARGNEYDHTIGKMETGQHQEAAKVNPFETTVYDYFLNPVMDVPEIVCAYAGPQDLTDPSAIPEKLKEGTLIQGVEDTAPEDPDVSPLPLQKPVNTLNDNPITYDEKTDTYTYHGQNSNNSNAYYAIENPFRNYDFSETPSYQNGHPVWTKGATISYWINVPKNAKDAAVLNFNLENDRQIQRNDAAKYQLCQQYTQEDESYSMGTQTTYVDAEGNEYQVLQGYGKNVQYNPNYPTAGCYSATTNGGAVYAYEKGADVSDPSNWKYLNYIGQGNYEHYSCRFDEEGGSKSLVKEAQISGSLSIYASGTMGYRQDNWYGLQMNPYLKSYGQVLDVQQYNQFYYWGNGGYETLDKNFLAPSMAEKDEWHFVVVVIQNDWIQFYMDGIEMDVDYLSWWGQPINVNTGSKNFNLGYGHKKAFRTSTPPSMSDSLGMSILDFISDEDTVLTVGGVGAGAARLGQENIKTPDGVQVKNFEYYNIPVEKSSIKKDQIVLDPEPSDPPGTEPPENPSENITGDVDGNGKVDLADAQLTLKAALKIETLQGANKAAADVNGDGTIDLTDAQLVLKRALKIIPSFS